MNKIYEKIEEYFISADENGGVAVFDKFADQYHELFEGDFDVEGEE